MCAAFTDCIFYQPGDFVSRSTLSVLAVERISCLCCQICVDTTIKHLRKQGAVRGLRFSSVARKIGKKAVKLLGKKIVTICWDGQMLILAEDQIV